MPLNYNGIALLKALMPSWVKAVDACPVPCELVMVDNASHDDSKAWCEAEYPEVTWIQMDQNAMLSSYNVALSQVSSEYVMILNNDVELSEHVLEPLVILLDQHPDAFAVMPKIIEDGHQGFKQRCGGRFFHGHLAPSPLDLDRGGTLYCHGAAMLVRREKFLELGGFDPLFFYQEDNDLSYRAWRRGWSCWFEPQVKVRHLGSQTTHQEFKKTVDRRALKEKANACFVLKNVQNKTWLLNFMLWTVLKSLKMLVTLDRQRAWATWQVMLQFPALMKKRREQNRLDDLSLLARVESCRAESSRVSSSYTSPHQV